MFDDDVEEIETREVAAPMVGVNQSMLQVRSSYATAVHVQRPRNLREVEKEFLQEADLAGSSFYYGWGVQDKSSGSKKAVEGPSIGLCKSLMRCWGNCAIEMLPMQDLPTAWVFTAIFVDLEKGVSIPRQFRQSKNWQVYGKMDAERKEDVRFQIGQSKALRNVIRAALPDWLVQKGMERAKLGEMQKLEKYIEKNGIEKAREVIVDELKKFGATTELILLKLERPTFAAITKEDMVLLKGDIQALRTGQDSLESLYAFKDAANNGATHAKASSLKDDLKARAVKNNPAAKNDEPAVNGEQRKIIAAAGFDATAMLQNGFEFRYIMGESGDQIIDQQTGEAIPLKTGNGASNGKAEVDGEDTKKSSPAAADAATHGKNGNSAPYPEDWPERRKSEKPHGYDLTWADTTKCTERFLKTLQAKKVAEAEYEIAFRAANQ